MKKILFLLLPFLLLVGCSSAPEASETTGMDETAEVAEVAETEEVAEESGESIHAKNSYFILEDSAVEKLDSAEYKMLINLEDYSPEILWDLMKEAAAETGVVIEEEDDPMERKYRNVQYIDNEYGMMNNFGYVLRYRQKWDEFSAPGSPDNVPDDKFDVTIKYRSDNLEESINIPLSVGSAFADIEKSPEMESDISPYGIKYSWAIKVKPKLKDFGEFADLFEPSIASFAELYPNLLNIGLPADTVITPVGGLTILEEKVEPALMYLDCGAEMEVAFSVFFIDGEKLVAEASFDFDTVYEVKDADGNKIEKKMTPEDFKQTEAFYRAILNKYDERLNFGWSKTKFVYDTLFPDAGVD